MKKILSAVIFMILLIASCNSAKKEAAKVQEEARIQKLDSAAMQIESLKSEIDSSVKEVDNLINEL